MSNPAQALAEALRKFGPDLMHQPQRLRAVLFDLLSTTDAQPVIDALVAAASTGVATEIAANAAVTPDQVADWFRRLAAAGVPADHVGHVTTTWTQALGPPERTQAVTQIAQTLTSPTSLRPISDPSRNQDPANVTIADRPPGHDLTVAAQQYHHESSWHVTDEEIEPSAPAPATEPDPPKGLRAWWPTIAAAVVTIAAVAVGGPMILSNTRSVDTGPSFEPVVINHPLFDRRDIAQFTLTTEDLAAIVPTAVESVAPVPGDPAGYTVGMTAKDAACSNVFNVAPPVDDPVTATAPYLAGAYDTNDPWLWVDSVSRWYATPVAASTALASMTPTEGACRTPTGLNDGQEYPATVAVSPTRRIADIQVEHIRVTAGAAPWVLDRTCYLNKNVISCVTLSGTNTSAVTPPRYGSPIQKYPPSWGEYLDRRVATHKPYREG